MIIATTNWLLEPRRQVRAFRPDLAVTLQKNAHWDNIGNYFISQALTEILDFEKALVVSASTPPDKIDVILNN